MAERLTVNPLEASVILVNEIFGGNHYSQEVAKVLHGPKWREYYSPEENPFKPEEFLQDSQRSQLLLDTVDQVLQTLTDRENKATKMRIGFWDGKMHTQEAIGKEFGITRSRSKQIIGKSFRKLRHPSRSRSLKALLPERL